jgi:hypothetical protein
MSSDTALASAEREVLRATKRVARQAAIIERLQRRNHVGVAARAREVLAELHKELDQAEARLKDEREIADGEATASESDLDPCMILAAGRAERAQVPSGECERMRLR